MRNEDPHSMYVPVPTEKNVPVETKRTFDTGATRDTDQGKLDYSRFFSAASFRRYADWLDRERSYAWAAGLYEGEGCFYKGKLTNGHTPRLQIRMTDREPLDRFVAVVGSGKVYGPYRTGKGKNKSPTPGRVWAPNY